MPRRRPQHCIANKRQCSSSRIIIISCQLTRRVNNNIMISIASNRSYRDSTTTRTYGTVCISYYFSLHFWREEYYVVLSAARITLLISTAPYVCRCDANVAVDGSSAVQISVEDNIYLVHVFVVVFRRGNCHQSSIINHHYRVRK